MTHTLTLNFSSAQELIDYVNARQTVITGGGSGQPVKIEVPEPPEDLMGGSEVTAEILRANAQTQMQAGFKDQIKALLKKYKAANISAVTESDREAFNTELMAIK